MNRESLYHKTVDILVQAYFNDTLQNGNYCACAVGNIIASNLGYDQYRDINNLIAWRNVSDTMARQWFLLVFPEGEKAQLNEPIANYQINSTGYDLEDIVDIENAFENASDAESDDEKMFNGLMAVIDQLDKIHGNKSADITAASKQKFNKVLVDAT